MQRKKVVLINLIDGTSDEAKSLAKMFTEVDGYEGYEFTVVAGRKIEAFFGVLSDKWRAGAQRWLDIEKRKNLSVYDGTIDGIRLILEALLQQ